MVVAYLCAYAAASETSPPADEVQLLSNTLVNRGTTETNRITLELLLTLKQTVMGQTAAFEAPIAYDALRKINADLSLLLDPGTEDSRARRVICTRATNGNCLLYWDTSYDAPGKRAVRARLGYPGKDDKWYWFTGPAVSVSSTNLCQFDIVRAEFTRSSGGDFYAELVESNATYSIELKMPDGTSVKTFAGQTSNGVIEVAWRLPADYYTNNWLLAVWHVDLPKSGRSQTLQQAISHLGSAIGW